MNATELAEKALYMQRDYTNQEIAELLEVRLEDLNTAIENYKKTNPDEGKVLEPETKTKPRKKKSS